MRRWLAKQPCYSPIAADASINHILDSTPEIIHQTDFAPLLTFP
jgi:hypothetical protein